MQSLSQSGFLGRYVVGASSSMIAYMLLRRYDWINSVGITASTLALLTILCALMQMIDLMILRHHAKPPTMFYVTFALLFPALFVSISIVVAVVLLITKNNYSQIIEIVLPIAVQLIASGAFWWYLHLQQGEQNATEQSS